MNRYSDYKPSNIDWIGDIPAHWEVKKLKYLLLSRLEYGANEAAELDDRKLPRYIRITDFGDDGFLKNDTFKSLPREIAQNYFLQEGDILFARSGATVGKTFQFKGYEGEACFAGYLIRARPSAFLSSDFFYSFTKSGNYENWKNSIFNQATIQNIGADKYSILEVPLPPLAEQVAIAAYLDEQTAQLDGLIARKQRLMILLREEKAALINEAVTKGIRPNVPTKPSGIDWLGDVPAHWEVKKLKWVATIISGAAFDSSKFCKEGNIRVLKISNIQHDYIDWVDTEYLPDDYASAYDRFRVFNGDIIFALTRPIISSGIKSARAFFDDSEQVFLNQRNAVLRVSDSVNDIFLYHITHSQHFFSLFENSIDNTGQQPNISPVAIANFGLPFPPLAEQAEIVRYLDEETAKIDFTVGRIEREIELMQEYRTALISEVVTGKVKVV
ncbi:restriction endonuclease subunit S [Spirosoma luteolum]